MSSLKRAIFLDRDGVINDVVDRGDNCVVLDKQVRWTAPWTYAEFILKPGVIDALQKFKAAGYLIILATNQPDLAYGTMKREDHDKIMTDIRALPFDDIFICEHGRDEGCGCKKPKPGMLLEAGKKWHIDLAQLFIVGDTKSDMGTGQAAGCKVIIIDHEQNQKLEPDYRVKNLSEVMGILKSV